MLGRHLTWSLSTLLILTGAASSQAPRFVEYPAFGDYTGKNAVVLLRNMDDKEFRTRLQSAARQRPNFAKHYIVTAWGCGAECLARAVIDANSGDVHWFPHTICCREETDDKFRPIDYRLDSRLIVFVGERNEKTGDDGTHFYDFRDGKFVHVKSVMKRNR